MGTKTAVLALLACFLLLLGCANLRDRRIDSASQGGGEIPSPGSAQQVTAGGAQQDSSGAAQQQAQAGATPQGGSSGEPENPQQQAQAASGGQQSAPQAKPVANPQALLSLSDADLDILEDSDSTALDELPLAGES